MTSNELIQRYLLGLTTEEEVRELEACLANDEKLQGELLLQAELDAHLRQEVQLTVSQREEPEAGHPRSLSASSMTFWKWVSGLSTLVASILLGALVASRQVRDDREQTVYICPTTCREPIDKEVSEDWCVLKLKHKIFN